MKLPIYQVDAFTRDVFRGNPAAVVVMESWPADSTLQAIARENNLSETAFLVQRTEGEFELRWFTPELEIDLCGHATLASAFILFNHDYTQGPEVLFHYRGGLLKVEKSGELLTMDFPSRPPESAAADDRLTTALGVQPEELHRSRDLLAVFRTQAEILDLKPDFAAIARMETPGLIVTAPGTDCDFVSRFFAPRAGVPEDPVTGSAHCTLIPFWSKRLGRSKLHARQLSARGGELFCEDLGDRVKISGYAVEYMQGSIIV